MLLPLILEMVLDSAVPSLHWRRLEVPAPAVDGRRQPSTRDDPTAVKSARLQQGRMTQAASERVAPMGRTPMSPVEARRHLDFAYRWVVKKAPEARTLALLMAQWALETGRGQSMWGYNFGGIKATTGGVAFDTRESFGARAQRSMHRFRTYRSAVEGAVHYIQTLTAEFPKAFAALQGGCADTFVRALADEGYFTGDPAEYVKAISKLAQTFERLWPNTETSAVEAT